jgi:hypothetical protein
MNRWLTYGLAASLLLSGNSSIAADEHHEPASEGKAATAPSTRSPALSTQPGASMMQMDDHMKKMQTLHDRMMNAASPEERQNVMQEARKEMQDSMAMMKPRTNGEAMRGSGMMPQKGKAAAGDAQIQMLEKRVDMMQMMMQMMMDQQGMTAPPK